MKEFTYVIKDPVGLHARPAGAEVVCRIEGEDEDAAHDALAKFFEENL